MDTMLISYLLQTWIHEKPQSKMQMCSPSKMSCKEIKHVQHLVFAEMPIMHIDSVVI